MGSIVDLDCVTGRATIRDESGEESAARQQLQAAVQKAHQARQDEQAMRDATLAQVAVKVGVDPDELKAALRLGPMPGKKTK